MRADSAPVGPLFWQGTRTKRQRDRISGEGDAQTHFGRGQESTLPRGVFQRVDWVERWPVTCRGGSSRRRSGS